MVLKYILYVIRIHNHRKPIHMNSSTVRKAVRIHEELLSRIEDESRKSGRTKNVEILALLTEALIARGSLIQSTNYDELCGETYSREKIEHNYNGLVDITMSKEMAGYIDQVSKLVSDDVMSISENFSEKVRFLLLSALSNRGQIIQIELGTQSSDTCLYNSADILSDRFALENHQHERLQQIMLKASTFNNMLTPKNRAPCDNDNVLIMGTTGSGKTLLSSQWMRQQVKSGNPVHYLNLWSNYDMARPNRIMLMWKSKGAYRIKQTLIIDEITLADEDYLNLFLNRAQSKNVRVICITQKPDTHSAIYDNFGRYIDLNTL